MVTKAQKLRLGIFITVISVLMVIFLIMVAGTKIMEKRDIYHIRYQDSSVTGLQIGGPVKYRGIGIGRVDDISIDPESITDIIVTVSIKSGTPIKGDMTASLIPIGITGYRAGQIRLLSGHLSGCPSIPGLKALKKERL